MPSTYPGAVRQDWESVVLHKSKPAKAQELRDPKASKTSGPVVHVRQLIEASKTSGPVVHVSQLIEASKTSGPVVHVSQLLEALKSSGTVVNANEALKKMPSRNPGAVSQDWESVVLHKSKPAKAQELRDPKAVNQALRSGVPVLTVKKFDGGSNKKTSGPVVNARKLDEAAEPDSLNRVSVEVRQAIQKARLEKKMSQSDLAKQINERPQVVQEYENGKAVPNQAVLAKMERVLGVKLRGKISK